MIVYLGYLEMINKILISKIKFKRLDELILGLLALFYQKDRHFDFINLVLLFFTLMIIIARAQRRSMSLSES